MKEKEQEKKNYEVPMLTVVDFKMERGYAISGIGAARESYTNSGDNANDQSGNNQSWF